MMALHTIKPNVVWQRWEGTGGRETFEELICRELWSSLLARLTLSGPSLRLGAGFLKHPGKCFDQHIVSALVFMATAARVPSPTQSLTRWEASASSLGEHYLLAPVNPNTGSSGLPVGRQAMGGFSLRVLEVPEHFMKESRNRIPAMPI